MTREDYIKQRRALRPYQELEGQAVPWQQAMRQNRYNPDTAIGPPPWTGATTAESSAPSSPALGGISDGEYARRAAVWRAKNRPTRFYDGFEP